MGMLKHKHVAGPWNSADDDATFIYALAQKGWVGKIARPNMVNAFSLQVRNDNNLLTREELEATARIVKHSPELLAAIQIFLIAVKHGEITVFPKEEGTADYVQILENAAKNATGE